MKITPTQRAALVVFVVTFAVYVFPFAYDIFYKPFFTWTAAQDIASTSVLPIAILERGDFALDQFRDFYKGFQNTYFVAEVNGKLISRSPVVAAVLAIPFYGLPLGTGWMTHPPHAWLVYPWSGFLIAKLAAAFITALAVLMFFFCVRELADTRTSAALALVFALGTSAFSTASQALWQQTPSLLFQVIGIWFLLRGRRQGADAVAPAAFFFSAATASRPNNALIALLFTIYVAIKYRSALWHWIVWAIPPALFFFAYNAIYNGSPFVFGLQDGALQYLHLPSLEGIVGLFISPSRGILVYSPFFVFAFYGIWLGLRGSNRMLYLFVALAIVPNVLLFSMMEWDGGWGYGTRLITDVLPYAMLLLIPGFMRLRGLSSFAFWTLTGYAAILQTFGLWDYGVQWHWHWSNYVYNVWDVAESEPLFYLKHYLAMGQHLISARLFR